jgi:acetylornithine deacetylase/succinyl-diaminopimelate desuccinylase-like protein
MENAADRVYQNPAQILQKLIRFDTTNPPGNETECIRYIYEVLTGAGFDPIMLGKVPERQNMVLRVPGKGAAAPLMMCGHADVVTTEDQTWQVPPFEGIIKDGFVWGRGALDMKGALAMMLSALLRLKQEGVTPPGDLVFAVVSDEENGGIFGAKYLTEEHAGLFEGIEYAIGELGGFTLHFANKRVYPIMISEKQRCTFEVTVSGTGGHGSFPIRGGAMAKLAAILQKLDTKRLPVHITPPVKMTLEALAKNMSFPVNLVFRLLLYPWCTDFILNMLGEKGKFFDPLLHNTLSATIVRGGDMINVIPGEASLVLDGRMLPGLDQVEMVREVEAFIGGDADIKVTYFLPGPSLVNMGLFDTLADILKSFDPEAIPIPFVGIGVSDARFFSKLGIQTYGFTPMILPKEIDFSRLIHGANERVPIDALEFGTNCIYKLMTCR